MEVKCLPRAALVGSALLLAAPLVVPSWVLFILTLALAKFMAVLAVALFLRAGLVSFGHALFYGVGAYTVGFSAKWFGLGEALLLVPLGALLAAGVAALVGLFMARYRGVFFAMLNLAVSMLLYAVLLKLYRVTGGTDGIGVRPPTLLGLLPPREIFRMTYYYVTLVITGAVIYAVYRFLASPLGYFLKAVGDNEIRIEYSGESVQRIIYLTYILSGALGGLSGVLVAFTVGHIVPEYAFWIQSGEFVFVALLGGFGSVPGPLVGSIAFEFIRTYASKYAPEAWQMTLGIIMLLIILFRPGGLWTIYEALASRLSRRAGGVARG
ncbi:MAG: branched-chain amino acid ABC transporter permease [Nitrospinae bacterium]|nr:branched-chain amino acid ABC transporter permease [Nitrospinota bacterium]